MQGASLRPAASAAACPAPSQLVPMDPTAVDECGVMPSLVQQFLKGPLLTFEMLQDMRNHGIVLWHAVVEEDTLLYIPANSFVMTKVLGAAVFGVKMSVLQRGAKAAFGFDHLLRTVKGANGGVEPKNKSFNALKDLAAPWRFICYFRFIAFPHLLRNLSRNVNASVHPGWSSLLRFLFTAQPVLSVRLGLSSLTVFCLCSDLLPCPFY
jgi:hypothetical protein